MDQSNRRRSASTGPRADLRQFKRAMRRSRGLTELEPTEMIFPPSQNSFKKIVGVLRKFVGLITKARPGEGPLCALCGQFEFVHHGEPPVLFVVASPLGEPQCTISGGICGRCAQRTDLKAAAIEWWREISPGACELAVHDRMQ